MLTGNSCNAAGYQTVLVSAVPLGSTPVWTGCCLGDSLFFILYGPGLSTNFCSDCSQTVGMQHPWSTPSCGGLINACLHTILVLFSQRGTIQKEPARYVLSSTNPEPLSLHTYPQFPAPQILQLTSTPRSNLQCPVNILTHMSWGCGKRPM